MNYCESKWTLKGQILKPEILTLGNILRIFSYKGDMKYSRNISSENRLCFELKLEADVDNANLMVIWPHLKFCKCIN